MTRILIKRGNLETDRCTARSCGDEDRDLSDASTSQRTPRSQQPPAGERADAPSRPSEGHLGFGLPAARAGRQQISHLFCGGLFPQPRKLTHQSRGDHRYILLLLLYFNTLGSRTMLRSDGLGAGLRHCHTD